MSRESINRNLKGAGQTKGENLEIILMKSLLLSGNSCLGCILEEGGNFVERS